MKGRGFMPHTEDTEDTEGERTLAGEGTEERERRRRFMPHTEDTEAQSFFRTQRRAGAR